MPDEVVAAQTTPTESVAQESIVATADQPVVTSNESVLDVAGSQEKAAQEAENSKLLAADPKTLSPENVTKRDGLLKAKEEADKKAILEQRMKGVPEKYDIKEPEGVKLQPERMTPVYAEFKKMGLTNDQAQGMVNLFVAQQKMNAEESATTFKNFLKTSADETMKALGSNAKTELAYVAKVKNYLSPETLDILNSSGMGNIKCFIQDLAKIGRMFSEEKNVDTGKGSGTSNDPASKLFPNLAK